MKVLNQYSALALLLLSQSIANAESGINQATASMFSQQEQQSTQDDLWGDDWEEEDETLSPWQSSGFVELGYGRFSQNNVTPSQQSMAEIRTQLALKYVADWGNINSKTDLLVDDVTAQTEFDIRELNLTLNVIPDTDVTIGRQVITWGTGDYLFLNDLFAKDWQSFFAGREDAYLKAPNDALRILHYQNGITFDLVYAPEFTADNYLNGERFSFYSPMTKSIIAPRNFPVTTTDKEQFSARIKTTINSIEYALYGYKGFWTTPTGQLTEGVNAGKSYFPSLISYGASIRMPFMGGLFNAEFASYNSTEDSRGTIPTIANGQLRFLLGYEQELFTNFTGAFQFYLEKTKDYNAFKASAPMPDLIVDEHRQVLTARFTHLAYQQRLTTSLFAFYSPTDKDAYIKPSITYRVNDQWQYSAGANIFLGDKQHTFFGQHQDNSNIWLRARFNY
ncbi:hypothetical protein [Thalassotalea sediminis]|uniref:hypothetical protein n=1 Tax=Thalassotalea sediminis TaxID=1759089 RepID=UPI0025722A31|nr:hypothetical protein [Thalassotalea sediminis]